jgi:hypothetical protein
MAQREYNAHVREKSAELRETYAQRRMNDADVRETKKPTDGELFEVKLEGWLLISKPTTSRFIHHFIFTRKKKESGFSPMHYHQRHHEFLETNHLRT